MTDNEFATLYKSSTELEPSPKLKEKILAQTTAEIENKNKKKHTSSLIHFSKKWITVAACFVFMFIMIGSALGLNYEDYQTVYIDVNPSVALHMNRFNKVNKVEYFNDDAKDALKGIKLKGLSSEKALEKIIDACDCAGYFYEDDQIYFSTFEKSKNSDKLLMNFSELAEEIKGNRNYSVNTSKLTNNDKIKASEYCISPGKYRLISEIINNQSDYTVEDLKDKSMSELKSMIK